MQTGKGAMSWRLVYTVHNKTSPTPTPLTNTHPPTNTQQALKKFLALGQGDFVTCLMDLVGPDLGKLAGQVYRHDLTGKLEAALRASNAQVRCFWDWCVVRKGAGGMHVPSLWVLTECPFPPRKNNYTHASSLPTDNTKQYEQPDVLNRLGVRLLEASAGEDGWEVRAYVCMYEYACMHVRTFTGCT